MKSERDSAAAAYAARWKVRNGMGMLRWSVSVRGRRLALFREEAHARTYAQALGEQASIRRRTTRADVTQRLKARHGQK